LPDIYLDTDTYNQAQGDLWERDQLNGLADRWASQATATLPSRVADAQDRVAQQQQAANQAAADQWEQQATAQYVTPEARPESVAGDQGVGMGSQTGLADAGSISDNASPPAAQPPDIQPPAMTSVPQDQPVQMGPMETAAPVAPTPQQPAVPAASAPVTAPLQQPAATGYEQMARQAAQQNGLDPDIFVRQLTQESGLQPYNPDGTVKTSPAGARGVAQFMPDTARGLGINPDDPNQAIPAAAQYMAGLLKQNGGDYSRALAAYNAGQGNVDKFGGVPPFAETQKYVSNILSGAGQAVQQKAQDVAQAVQNVGGQVASRVSQFALGLSSADAAAFCGPAAAIAFAKTYGRNPTADEAKALAAQVGWNPSQGMAGVQSEQKLLQSMGVPTTLESTVDWGHVAQDAAGGNPVILDTPGHYYYVDGVKQGPNGEQQFHVGTSGTDLRGGGEWMTSAQINAMPQSGGAVRAALYADHPMGPGQSIASASSPTDMQTASLPTPDTGQQPIGSQPRQERSMFDPLKQLGDTISSAITTGLQSLFGTSDQPNPIAQAITPNLTDPTRSMFGNNPVPTTQQPSTTGMAAQAAFGTPQQPRGPNEALTAGEQALGQNVVAPVLNALGQPGGALRDQRQGLADALTSATQGSPIPGVAGAGQAIGGMIAAPTVLDSIQTIQDMSKKYPGPNGLPNLDAMTAQDRQAWDQATVAVAGVASPLHADNPHMLSTDPLPGYEPISPDEAVNHLSGLEQQYTQNDARIQQLETQINEAGRTGAKYMQTRPPWAVGWTDAALAELARLHGTTSSTPNWFNDVGLYTGSGEARFAAQEVDPNLGGAKQTLTQMRGELQGLYTDQDRIMAASEHAVDNGAGQLYRRVVRSSPEPLPFDTGAQPADAAGTNAPNTFSLADLTRPSAATAQAAPAAATVAQGPAQLATGAGGNLPPIPPTLPRAPAMPPGGGGGGNLPPTTPGGAARLAQSANPLLQRTGQMLEAKPPAPATDSLVNRLVRATTNRFEAADRYQQDAINQVGLNPANPPQDLDLSAALRMQSSPAAEVRIQQELAPAIQTVGEQDRNWLSAYLMHANNVDVANALGNPDRTFPGGFKASDSQQVLGALPNELGPQRWQNVQDAAQQIYSFTGSLRQRMVDSGLISQQTASDWATKYPHWVPTRVLDYMDEAGGPKVGTKISLADNGVRQYTEDGTARFAEDPLASLVGLAQQVESKAMRNEAANAIVLLDQIRGPGNQLLTKTDRPVQANETVIQRINNGTVERYIAPPELAAVINGPAITQAPAFVRAWTGFLRSVTTVLSPAFALVRNPMLDIPEYMTRELARAGGNPLQLPHILGELAQGYADAFKGYSPLTEGKFAGQGAQEFMLSGGGGAGLASNTFANRADAVARLAQDGHVLGSAADVGRVLKDLVTLKPVARTAERTELGPRIASMRLAQQRGATQARATLAGRTVTLDFNEGGTVAKTINQFVPFFNAGIQGSMAVPRMIGEHPVGAVASMMMTAGLPAVAAEAWNNADPQRAKDYADVPDYLKQQGVVVMMPGDAPTDDRGNRRPQFWWINMRGMAPLSSIAREATGRVMQVAGNGSVQPEDWQHLIGDSLFGMSPIRANTIGDVPGSLSPQFVPGADVGLQLMLNKDIFRGSDIVTPRKDQYASAVGKSIANGLTAVARLQNPAAQVHPSQVDFTLQQMLGGVGSSIMGASNAIAGQRSDDAPQSAPVLGGLVRAAGVRGDTGQVLQDARAQVLEPEAQRVLNDAGLPIPLPQPGTIHVQGFGVPLHQDEQARYQQLYSQLSSQLIVRYASQLRSAQNLLVRQQLLSRINDIARTQAEQQILSTIPGPQITQRVRDENARQAAGIR
jgi:soluble lytic murein transglycosylase-like protein